MDRPGYTCDNQHKLARSPLDRNQPDPRRRQPHRFDAARESLRLALPRLTRAAGAPVTGAMGDANPLSAIEDEMNLAGYDEIIISTLGRRFSRWLRLDVVSKARALGVPVTHVRPDAVDACMLEPEMALP